MAVELPRPGLLPHGLAVIILVMHLMGMSHLLRHQQPQAYPRGRWLLAVLVLVGAFLGLVTELPRPFVNTGTAFLAGIIMINVVAEELPLGHKNKLWWFLLGICLFLLATFIITSTPLREGYSPY